MDAINPHAGRGGGGRHYRRRGGRKGRGGRGRGGQEGLRGKATFPEKDKTGDAAVAGKQAEEVVVEKIHNENKSPQDPKPATPIVSLAKNVENLKKVLGIGVVDTTLTSSTLGDTNNAGARDAPSGTADNAPSDKEKMQQKLKEAREQAAVAKEKKKFKKSKKHEKWLKEQQQQQEDRAKSWTVKVKREEEKCQLISDLIGTEFQRVNKGVNMNEEIQNVITDKSKEAHDAMYGSEIRCRVTVVGLDRKDINGRKGSIRHWDEDKGKFFVGLDTKKSRDCDVHFLKPENLDALSFAQSAKKDGKKLVANFIVSIAGLMTQGDDDVGFQFSLEKSDVDKLESAHSRSNGLQAFWEEREELALRLKKEQEEQHKEEERLEKEEEEDRKRRAELRAKKRAEKELRKEEQRQKREKAFKSKQMQARMEFERKQEEKMRGLKTALQKAMLIPLFGQMYQAHFHEWADDGGRLEDFDDFKEEFKDFIASDREVFEPLCGVELGEQELDEILEEIFERTDKEFKRILLEERLEDDKKHAEILGVSHDVDKRTLQKAYRKLALQYHPDKWSADSAHGMGKEEAEEHFKSIRSSYDHLMVNFDE
eukprot:scaffold3320_cov136-Skeletonema_menzelii.AAC.12